MAATLGLLALAACAANHKEVQLAERGDKAHPHYVGRSDSGDVVLSASHYQAMSGMAVAAPDVGGEGQDPLFCAREMPTGTHVPKWVCRYPKQVDQGRIETQNALIQPEACGDCKGN